MHPEFYVEKESLLKRGLVPEELIEDLEFIDHQKVSALMVENRLQFLINDANLRGIDIQSADQAILEGSYESLVDLMVSCD